LIDSLAAQLGAVIPMNGLTMARLRLKLEVPAEERAE
jgi:hypothetical protein